MDKRTLNKILGFILLFICILTVGNNVAFSETVSNTNGGNNWSIGMEEGQNLIKPTGSAEEFKILDIKLSWKDKEEWLLKYDVNKDEIDLFLLGGGNGNLRWIELNNFRLKKTKFKIKTQGIKEITLINKNDKYNIDKTITKSYTEWEEGISFPEFGNKNGEVDIDNPPTLIFHTKSGEDISYKLNFKEGELELPFKVRISLITSNPYDKTATGGIVKYDEEGKEKLISFGYYEIGDTVTIKAIDGEKSKFKEWSSVEEYQNPPEGHDPSKYIILEDFIGDITKNELTFTIDEKFKNLKNSANGVKDQLSLRAYFDTFSKIYINTSEPTNDKLIATVDRDVVPTGEQFTIEAKSEDENLVFDRWEMDPIITGYNTDNPNVNLEMNKLTLNMPNLANDYELENSYRLYVIAHFKERDKEPEIEKIEPINVEVYIGDTYQLPEEVEAIMTDGSKRMIKVDKWDPSIPYEISEEKDYFHSGEVQGKTVQLKVKGIKTVEKQKHTITFNTNGGSNIPPTEIEKGQKLTKPADPIREGYKFIGWYSDEGLTEEFDFNTEITENITLYAKWEEEPNEPIQEILEITSVELIKEGKVISKGVIKGKNITLELPEGYDESIIEGNHILKITGTEGANLAQHRGYDGPIEKWAAGDISNSIMAGQSKKFTIYKDDNSVDYTIEILEATEPTPPVEDKYTITFNSNGGSSVNPQILKANEKVYRPADPTKSDYKFIGWYEDSSLTRVFDFNTPITKNMNLFAKWEKINKPEPIKKKDAKIISFSLAGIQGIIYDDIGYIYVNLPFDIDLEDLVPSITYSEGADIYPRIGKPRDFNEVVNYTVSGEGLNSKTYKVYVTTLSDYHRRDINYNDLDWYEARHNKYWYKLIDGEYWYRSSDGKHWYRSKDRKHWEKTKEEKDWYEMTQEIKKKRLEEEKEPSLTSKEVKAAALNKVGQITAQSGGIRRDVSIKQFSDHMEVKQNSKDKGDFIKNQINIPSGVLTELNELGFDYLKYSTNLVRVKIFPFMDSADGVIINIRPAPSERNNDIQYIWAKTKGAGKLFEIETNSTKAGLSFEMKLDKKLPSEYIRVVKFNYMKQKFEDLSPEKWSVVNERVYVEQVSGGIYGIIYKK